MTYDCTGSSINKSPLHGRDPEFAKCKAKEYMDAFGTRGLFYHIGSVNMDPVYQEPLNNTSWKWDDGSPYELNILFERERNIVDPEEKGATRAKPGRVRMALKDFELNNIPYPVEGDIIRFWNRYYDITHVDEQGWINSDHVFVGFLIEVRRNTQYLPEKRIT